MTRPQTAAFYVGHVTLSILLRALLAPFGEWPLRVPFAYQTDGVLCAALIKGIGEDGPLHLTRIGAPFGVDVVDWQLGMWLPFGVTSALVRITGHPGAAMNLYWLLTIALSGVSATWALRRLCVAAPPAFVFGLLYAFFPCSSTTTRPPS